MPTLTRVCQCSSVHSTRTMASAFPADDQSSSLSLFSGLFLYHFNFILGPGFIPTLSSKNMGRRWKPGWFGPRVWPPSSRYSAWLNKQQWTGRRRERGGEDWGDHSGDWCPLLRGRLGGPDGGGTEGAFFCFILFCAIRMGAAVVVWGPLYCETVQDPTSLNSLPLSSITKRPSLIHM